MVIDINLKLIHHLTCFLMPQLKGHNCTTWDSTECDISIFS